jgi:hypothetical protein
VGRAWDALIGGGGHKCDGIPKRRRGSPHESGEASGGVDGLDCGIVGLAFTRKGRWGLLKKKKILVF